MNVELIVQDLGDEMVRLTSTGTGVQNISDHRIYSEVITKHTKISDFRAM